MQLTSTSGVHSLRLVVCIYIEIYGNNACFLTQRSELYYSVIYLNGTSMNIEQKTFVQQVEPTIVAHTSAEIQPLKETLSNQCSRENTGLELTFKVRIM